MNTEQFCYWLQGFAEINTTPPTPEQWKAIVDHLQTVFCKVTPQVEKGLLGGLQYVPPKQIEGAIC